jgi:hypothetical protein
MSKGNAAGNVRDAARKCSSELQGKCTGLAAADSQRARELLENCDRIAREAGAIAAEKTGQGIDMGQLAQLAGAAAQMMGAMQPKGGAKPESGVSSAYSPTPVAQASPSTSGLGSGQDTLGTSAGFSNTNPTGASLKNDGAGGTGFAGPVASRSFEPSLAAALGGTEFGAFDGAGNGIANTTPSQGAGGGGGFGSSGASMMGDGKDPAAAAADALNRELAGYELGAGGGGGGRPFLGLKSKSGDLGDLGGDDLGNGLLGDLGLDDDHEYASEGSYGDIRGEDGVTLFRVIHSKYAEMKKRGSI